MDILGDELQRRLIEDRAAADNMSVNQVFTRWRGFVLQVVQRDFDARLKGRLDPADIAQETLLEVTLRLTDFLERRPMPLQAWLHRTACQRLRMAWREHRRAQRRTVDREVAFEETALHQPVDRRLDCTPDNGLQRRELIARVQEALEQVPPSDRDLIVMRNFQNLNNGEVAARLGIHPAAASKRYTRALGKLRRHLHRLADHS